MDSVENAHYLADPSAKEKKGKTVIIWPRGLDIVWGGDSRYWNIQPDDNNNPAELRQVCWLEVTTSVKNSATNYYIDPKEEYEVGFQISFAPDAFGWGTNYPIYFMTKRGNRDASWKKITLMDENVNKEHIIKRVVNRIDSSEAGDDIISFGLYEVWSGKWKGGLRIHRAFVTEFNED